MKPDQLVDKTARQFDKIISAVMLTASDEIAGILSKLELIAGRLDKSAGNTAAIAALLPKLQAALEKAGYTQAVKALQATDTALIKAVISSARVKMAFSPESLKTLQSVRDMQALRFAEIGQEAMRAVRESVMRGMNTGQHYKDIADSIREMLTGKYRSYATTYCTTTRQMIMQTIHDTAARETTGTVYWVYIGPDDDVTRPACQELLAIEYFTDAEREQYEAQYADERAYNCRHIFMQVSPEMYKENKGAD